MSLFCISTLPSRMLWTSSSVGTHSTVTAGTTAPAYCTCSWRLLRSRAACRREAVINQQLDRHQRVNQDACVPRGLLLDLLAESLDDHDVRARLATQQGNRLQAVQLPWAGRGDDGLRRRAAGATLLFYPAGQIGGLGRSHLSCSAGGCGGKAQTQL